MSIIVWLSDFLHDARRFWSVTIPKVICSRQASCLNSDNQTTTIIQRSLRDYKGLLLLMLWLHISSTSNEITLVGGHMNHCRQASLRQSNNNNNNQLSLTDFEGLFHLMLRLHVASTSNEITLVGDHTKSDLFPMGIMPELWQSNNNWHSTKSHRIWRVILFDVTTAYCPDIKWKQWFITDKRHAWITTTKQQLTFN